MRPSFHQVAPDRIEIRQGGGCLGIFGLPFFAAGIFMLLATLGVIQMSNADDVSLAGRVGLVFMGLVFTAVGGVLSFGRAWTTIDSTRREVITQYGLLAPMRTSTQRLDEYVAVVLGFVAGDSDSADSFPVTLKSRTGHALKLNSSAQYGEARACATAIATMLRLDFEDATSDHPLHTPAGQADMPLQQRLQMEGLQSEPTRPANARTEVVRELDGVRIAIPTPRSHPIAYLVALIPVGIALMFISPLSRFFRQTRTPEPVGLIFLGFIILFFAVLPAITALNGYLRVRRGRTFVSVSRRGIDIRERGAWRTGPVNSLPAAEILDVDFSTSQSATAAARIAVEQRVRTSHGMRSTPVEIGPRTQWLLTRIARYTQGHGITIKTRQGLITIGKGLDDDETRYLHNLIRRTLAGY